MEKKLVEDDNLFVLEVRLLVVVIRDGFGVTFLLFI